MILKPPFFISSHMLPAVKIGDGEISLNYVEQTRRGCMIYRWHIDIPAGEFTDCDLKSSCQGGSYQQMFGTLLCFLGSAAERRSYEIRNGITDSDPELFPRPVVEWACQYSEEITCLQMDLEEGNIVYINEDPDLK